MKLLFEYLKSHYKSIIMFFSFTAVFGLVFFLYSLPAEPVLYSAALCAFLGLVLFSLSFARFVKRHSAFETLLSGEILSLNDLPEPRTQQELDYAEIVAELFYEKQCAESAKMKAVSEITDYYTLWAHQIKTPIAAMSLLLQSGGSKAELEEQLFKIEEYVSMVLTYLRTDSDSTDYVLSRKSLDPIIKESVKKYAKLFIRKKISLDYTGVDMTVVTDEKWFGFVLEQLLSNALKYTHSGKITIFSDGGSRLVVEDTGIGIAAEDLMRVCEKGYTGYNGRADKKSTGIGLWLCKRVLTGLGHTLEITSSVGEGTRVTIGFDTESRQYE